MAIDLRHRRSSAITPYVPLKHKAYAPDLSSIHGSIIRA